MTKNNCENIGKFRWFQIVFVGESFVNKPSKPAPTYTPRPNISTNKPSYNNNSYPENNNKNNNNENYQINKKTNSNYSKPQYQPIEKGDNNNYKPQYKNNNSGGDNYKQSPSMNNNNNNYKTPSPSNKTTPSGIKVTKTPK